MPPAWSRRSLLFPYVCLLIIGFLLQVVTATECSATQLCASGCCSKYGFCGFTDEHCGSGCLSTCDAKPSDETPIGGGGECSASVPCKTGCCSKYGNCGFGEEYCSTDKGCVNNCGLKSECDAGWGLDWAERKTCPLSVCCSKYGFRGTTKEFCGEKDTIKRPSCDAASGSIDRVVGYFEQWSIKRHCEYFRPEEIPAGCYTHVNFAFASINPETFEVVEAEPWDDVLWERMRSLRLEQPSVEIWVALGGWLFNDPDQPTKSTFSDIAGSEENQKKFAKSLLAMMSKYGFDGVDIDWEYPVAEERSGRKEDFDNFPNWMRNLRSQLQSSGKKYGLTLTLPASYWYLQHFDIKRLQESVDWFNVMSYDMHGTWDQNNTWVGPFLNPHTNLTEIKGALDLLWRNDIEPAKVTMGLAYYGRSFTLSSPDCFEPGCTYKSGGNAGQCSSTVGFLLNSEIQTIISENGLTPKFYEEDAVKAIHWGDQWVSYDDADTFKIRGDFAKSQCLGGVMVWAISHDDHKSTSAEGLMTGLGKKRMQLPSYSAASAAPSTLTKRDDSAGSNVDVCRWTNCGENCPAGWKWIRRADSDTLSMTDETYCYSGQDSRKFCCPGDVDLPSCQWRGMPKHGGNCSPGCKDGEVEVGTLGYPYCQTKHQSACCTVTPSTAPYGECKWVGSAGLCSSSGGHKDCPSDYPTFVFASSNGAGGEQTCTQGAKSFCCKGEVPWQFKKCSWQKKATHYLKPDAFCESSCPEGQTRLGMHAGDCGLGWEAYCCAGDPPPPPKTDDGGSTEPNTTTVEPRDPNHLYYYEYQSLISRYMQDPGAPPDFHSYSWSPEEDQALVKRTKLNLYDFELFNTYNARTMVSNVQALIDLYDHTGPPVTYGDHFLMAEMNAAINQSGGDIDRYAYVSDLMANPRTADEALNYMDTAVDDLCTIQEAEGTAPAKRDTPAAESDNADLEERHINIVDISTDSKVNGQPTMRTILRGIRNGDLTLHYARWEHFNDRNNDGSREGREGPLLEIAYWIGSEIGTLGANANEYQETDNDKWVVFHFHYNNDGLLFRPKRKENKMYIGCTSITVFHGQTLDNGARGDNRIWNRDSGRNGNPNTGNTRSRALQCRAGQRWYIAQATVPSAAGNHYYATELAEFARTLYDQGYLGSQAFRLIYPGSDNPLEFYTSQYQQFGDGMNRNFLMVEREMMAGWTEWVPQQIGYIHGG